MNKKLGHDAIYDARELGIPRMLLLGLQHLFAMFGATVLVPILVTGYGLPLSIQTTLEGHVVTEVLDSVEEVGCLGNTAHLDYVTDDVAE